MKISVFGTGYVGLVTGVCFAEMGDHVTCVDIDPKKIESLRSGKSPIYEPGLDDLLAANLAQGRLEFTLDAAKAIHDSDILFIAVGTPPKEDGSADLSYVTKVADTIAANMTSYKLIVNKSTVPIGTQKKIKAVVQDRLRARDVKIDFDVASNPEFLREGCAIEDCLKPNRIVVGVESAKAEETFRDLYASFLKNGNPLMVMDPLSSEMTKYAANAMLATKISLMNEFSRVCEKYGADIESVRIGIGSDHRIGPHFIYAGVGYGGSCFPKDVSALVQIGALVDEDLKILKSVEETNYIQRERFYAKIKARLGPDISKKKVAIWGVAFKPGTDDIREAPALYIIEKLLETGATVVAYDPVASENARQYFSQNPNLSFVNDQYKCLEGVDLLVIPTEWRSFKDPDFAGMKGLMKEAIIFDGRNLYQPKSMKKFGLEYHSVGRPH